MSDRELRNRKPDATTSAPPAKPASASPSSSVANSLPPRRVDEWRPGAGPSPDAIAQMQNRNFVGGLVFAVILALVFLWPKIKEEMDAGTLWPLEKRHFTIHI